MQIGKKFSDDISIHTLLTHVRGLHVKGRFLYCKNQFTCKSYKLSTHVKGRSSCKRTVSLVASYPLTLLDSVQESGNLSKRDVSNVTKEMVAV